MASRSSTSVGAWVAITILSVVSLVLFIFTVALYGQLNTARAETEEAESELADFVRDAERDRAFRARDEAQQRGESVFAYLDGRLSTTMRLVTGSESGTVDTIRERRRGLPEALQVREDEPLLRILERIGGNLREAERRADEATEGREALQARFDELRDSYEQAQQEAERARERLAQVIEDYRTNVSDHVGRLGQQEQRMTSRVEEVRADKQARVAELQAEISEINEQNLVLQNQVQVLRGERRDDLVRPDDEYALVDGEVVGVDAAAGRVTINRGRRHNMVLGMTFSVYSDASAIRPDDQGEYPAGKAAIEVISIQENTATARIVRETRGDPVVRGDVIANAIYDPYKTYRFVVFGTFDANRDGRFTQRGRNEIISMIREWGGEVTDDLTGDVDFLILGRRPAVPPRPSPTAPVEIQQEWIRLDRRAERYDELFERAQSVSIPVLNQNRLFTFIGRN